MAIFTIFTNNNSEFMETMKSFKTFKSEIDKKCENVPIWLIKHLYKRYTLNRTINQIIKKRLMKKWRLIDIREYRKEGWFEICQPSWQVYYHKYGEEGRRKCSLLEKLQILGTAIWGACHGMKFSSKLMLSARILILFIAQ